MIEKLNYSGDCCSSGVLVSFSGLNLSLDQRYRVIFDNVNSIPSSTNVRLNPTGYFLSSSEIAPVLSTFFTSKSNFSDNSSLNTIRLSIYDSQNTLIHTDYKAISCQNLCGSGVPITPTPTQTPTHTPTPTPTLTPAPAPLNIQASFDRTVNKFAECQMLVRAKAYGDFNQTYSYSFGTDMQGVDLKISNPSGFITITELPTYVYTNITLPEQDKKYSLEFGLSDGTNNVQAAAIFSCEDGAITNSKLGITPPYPESPEVYQIPLTIDSLGNFERQDGVYLRFRQIDANEVIDNWYTIYIPEDSLVMSYATNTEAPPEVELPPDVEVIQTINYSTLNQFLPNGTYQIEYDILTANNAPNILSDESVRTLEYTRFRNTITISNSSIMELYYVNIALSPTSTEPSLSEMYLATAVSRGVVVSVGFDGTGSQTVPITNERHNASVLQVDLSLSGGVGFSVSSYYPFITPENPFPTKTILYYSSVPLGAANLSSNIISLNSGLQGAYSSNFTAATSFCKIGSCGGGEEEGGGGPPGGGPSGGGPPGGGPSGGGPPPPWCHEVEVCYTEFVGYKWIIVYDTPCTGPCASCCHLIPIAIFENRCSIKRIGQGCD